METAVWQSFNHDEVIVVGISNTNNQNIINNFVTENSLSFPILFDTGSPGGVQGGDIYDLYYMPNDGSPYPRDFVINQEGIISYANNEIDTTWMLSVISELLSDNMLLGDINQDGLEDIVSVIDLAPGVRGQNSPAIAVYFNTTEVVVDCPADIDGDGTVAVNDLLALIAAWGSPDASLDLDGSGVVDVGDLLVVIAAWGAC